MRIRLFVAWLTVLALLFSSSAWAQQHIADPTALQAAVAQQDATDAANRDVALGVLRRADVRQVAQRLGVTVERAENAVRQLPSDQLASVADQARAVQADLAGGGSTVTISVTTLLLILILIVLIAK